MEMEDEQLSKRIKLDIGDRPLNFATCQEESEMHTVKKPKIPRDPLSHRIIEKRRRDRMNNCLADLSRLIPSNYLKQGQGRIEKTEIIEMATRHIMHLQNLYKLFGENDEPLHAEEKLCCKGKFYLGFKDCQDEVMRFLVEQEGWEVKDPLCCRIMSHLDQTSSKFIISSSGKVPSGPDIILEEIDESSCPSMLQSDCGNTQQYPKQTSSASEIGQQERRANDAQNNYSCEFSNTNIRTLLTPKDGNYPSSGTSDEACLKFMALKAYEDSADFTHKREGASSLGSEISSVSKSALCVDSDQSSCSVYKFKHNITKRFSQEEKYHHHQTTSDTSSSSSRDDENTGVKRKMSRHKSRSPSSDSTIYPASSLSSNSKNAASHKATHKTSPKTSENMLTSNNIPLPAFVLHPKGSHYIPLSIHPSHVQSIFYPNSRDDSTSNNSTFHPISIPVNFSGPTVSIKHFTVNSPQSEEDFKSDSVSSGDSPSSVKRPAESPPEL